MKILIQELVNMGSIYIWMGRSDILWNLNLDQPILGPPSAILISRILKFASSHNTIFKSLGNG